MALELRIGDVVRMKKPHPCGNHLWQVRRLGADVGITCQKCRRHVMLPRSYLERRVKEVIPGSRPPEGAASDSSASGGPRLER